MVQQARADIQRACELGEQDGCNALRGGVAGDVIRGVVGGVLDGLKRDGQR
jgi:hypothetical protein